MESNNYSIKLTACMVSFMGIVICLLILAFLSGVQLAYLSANRLYFEVQNKQGVATGMIISRLIRQPTRFTTMLLIGKVLILVIYGVLLVNVLTAPIQKSIEQYLPIIDPVVGVPIALIFSATILLIASTELLPKSLLSFNPDGFLEAFSIPIWILYQAFTPLVWIFTGITKWIIKYIFRLEYPKNKPLLGLTDLNQYLQHLNKEKSEQESDMLDTKILNNALEFKAVRVRDCMVPRSEITAVEITDNVEILRKAFVESGHSRILVYDQTLENVVGYCHQLALFKKPKDIRGIMTTVPIVPQAMMAQDLMKKLNTERKSIALVVDEFGGTSGIITLEDMMEKIFGEIQDEFDQSENWIEIQLGDHVFELSARHEIDYLNEKYNWQLPEGDYDTLGGLVIATNEDLPQINEVVSLPPYTFTVLSMQDARIGTIRLHISTSE